MDASFVGRQSLRFRLRTLLLLPAIFTLGWWWLTWPDRTLKQFGDYLRAGNIDAARAMCDSPESLELIWKFNARNAIMIEVPTVAKVSWRDLLLARRDFRIPWTLKFPRPNRKLRGQIQVLAATRNRVSIAPANNHQLSVVYSFSSIPAAGLASNLKIVFDDEPGEFQLTSDAITARISDNSVITSVPLEQQDWLRKVIISHAVDIEAYRAAIKTDE